MDRGACSQLMRRCVAMSLPTEKMGMDYRVGVTRKAQ